MPTLHLHLRVIQRPTIAIPVMLDAAGAVLARANLRLRVLSDVEITSSGDVHVSGGCHGSGLSSGQTDLFATTASGPDEILVFFIRATDPPVSGCAQHPVGQPGALLTEACSRFTLAHEIGHLLGLHHVQDTKRLMHSCTLDITVAHPVLTDPEITTMQDSGRKSGLIHG